MTTRLDMAMTDALVDCRGSESEALQLPRAIASQWAGLRSRWMRRQARRKRALTATAMRSSRRAANA
jgi:hypothetical protein